MNAKQIDQIRRTLLRKRAAGLCAWPRCRHARCADGFCGEHSAAARSVTDSYVIPG